SFFKHTRREYFGLLPCAWQIAPTAGNEYDRIICALLELPHSINEHALQLPDLPAVIVANCGNAEGRANQQENSPDRSEDVWNQRDIHAINRGISPQLSWYERGLR